MAVERQQIGKTLHYRGSQVTVHEMIPDVLARVDGKDLGFYRTPEAARKGACRYIDETIKAQEEESK